MNVLCERAKARGFTIHDVAGDGNCCFHAVSYQLSSIGMQPIDASVLRTMVVEYLRANPTIIAMNNDNDEQVLLQLENFLDDLNNGIAIQGLSDMLCVTCNSYTMPSRGVY